MATRFGGGPVGLDTLAAAISEEADTIMEVDEPYLLKIGFLQCTPRGRTLACPGHEDLGLNLPAGVAAQPSFFDDEEA